MPHFIFDLVVIRYFYFFENALNYVDLDQWNFYDLLPAKITEYLSKYTGISPGTGICPGIYSVILALLWCYLVFYLRFCSTLHVFNRDNYLYPITLMFIAWWCENVSQLQMYHKYKCITYLWFFTYFCNFINFRLQIYNRTSH